MSQKLQLSISQPCYQNWQQMNATDQGKFCNACAKEVVDFTTLSDTEVLHYFIKGKKENVCGRFYNDQLNRAIEQPVYTAKKISWYWNYVVMIFLFLFRDNTSNAQVPVKPLKTEQVNTKDQILQSSLGGESAVHAPLNIEGSVTDEAGRAVAGATVQLKGKNKVTIADANGKYKLSEVEPNDFIVLSAVGYCSREVKASRSGNLDAVLKQVSMGEVVVVTVGMIAADYDYTAPPKPMHIAVIAIKDEATSQPLKAEITIYNNEAAETATATTHKDGVYKLRRIGEQESYRVTVSAKGYKDSVLNIDGWKFNERKETLLVFLKRKDTRAPQQRHIIMGGTRTNPKPPLYIIDGKLATPGMIKNIKPEEIEKIEVLKDPISTALYGSPAEAGVIIITTKKQPAKKHLVEAIKYKTATPHVIEKAVVQRIENFTIAPNPVEKGAAVTVSFMSTVTGDYSFQILHASGVVLQTKKVAISQHLNQVQLQTNAGWASGIYAVTISGINGTPMQAGEFILK